MGLPFWAHRMNLIFNRSLEGKIKRGSFQAQVGCYIILLLAVVISFSQGGKAS